MSLGDLINSVGDGLEHVATGAEHLAGDVLDGGAHLLGSGLDQVGLHGAANAVDNFGDSIADHLGDQVAEKQLGETDDPTQLIHGDIAAINQTASRLTSFATAFGETADGLARIDTAQWQGPAADAFRQIYDQHPRAWSDARDSCTTAASAWQNYARAAQGAQDRAKQAVMLFQHGTQATEQAVDRHAQAVAAYNQQIQNYQQTAAAGSDPGPMPRPPLPFSDPGTNDRQHAQDLLTAARHQREAAATAAQQAITSALAHAPATPTFSQRMLNDLSDATTAAGVEGEHFLGGAIKGAGGLVKLTRSLMPLDPYNITHPAEYVDGLSTTAAGLVHSVNHPMDIVHGVLGNGWRSDPADALGRLVPTVLGSVATDGGPEALSEADSVVTASRAALDHPPTSDGTLATDPHVHSDLAHTAMQQPDLSILDGLDDKVVWRHGSGALYRSGNRGADVFTQGFPPRDVTSLDLRGHVDYNPPNTGYISTTIDPNYWQTWGSDCKYFYEINAPGGIDVNATLAGHQNVHENEIAMPGGIRPERVKGLWSVHHDPLTHEPALGQYVPNPHYQPIASIGHQPEANH